MRYLLPGVLLFAPGCYTVQLAPIAEVPGQRLGPTAELEIPAETATYVHDVRSGTAGIANRWRLEVGPAFEAYAEPYLRPLFPEGDDLRLVLTLEGFDVRDFEAHIDARCAVDVWVALLGNVLGLDAGLDFLEFSPFALDFQRVSELCSFVVHVAVRRGRRRPGTPS